MITDDKIAEMIADCASRTEWVSVVINREQALAALLEFRRFRTLVTELRALLIRVESFTTQIPSSEIYAATQDYARSIAAQLDALLSAHGTQETGSDAAP